MGGVGRDGKLSNPYGNQMSVIVAFGNYATQ